MKKTQPTVIAGLSSLFAAVFLEGCGQMLLFDPKGPVGDAERFVIIAAVMLMLIVVIPVVAMVFLFPRKYRASNTNERYMPKWDRSTKIELVIWLVPAIIITVLGTIVWKATVQLDPYKPIDTGVKSVNIEAVSLDWKWLFIYPDQNIATVNQLVFPVHVPLSFRLTSDTVMTSFFIPQLGSQIYAMAGMQTRLHLMADEPGTYTGQNQQFSGRGYADMKFKAIAVSGQQFNEWVQKVRQSSEKLSLVRFEELKKPSIDYAVSLFSSVKPDLFDHIVGRFSKTMNTHQDVLKKRYRSKRFKTGTLEGS